MQQRRPQPPATAMDIETFEPDDAFAPRVPRYLGESGRWEDGSTGPRYEIVDVLSTGGFGAIFVAEDRKLWRKKCLVKVNKYDGQFFQSPNVALDVMLDEIHPQRHRIEFERNVLATAQKRNITGVPVLIDSVTAPNPEIYGPHEAPDGTTFIHDAPELYEEETYLVLQYIQGQTLKDACTGPIWPNRRLHNAKQVILQVGRVLKALHAWEEQGGQEIRYIYQDLNPANVIWTPEYELMVIDFGACVACSKDSVYLQNTWSYTPGYAPPELMRNEDNPSAVDDVFTPQLDVFSLGATVWHLLAGRAPDDPRMVDAPHPLDDLDAPDCWKEWLTKSLAESRDDRFSDMQEAIDAAHTLEKD